MYDLLIKNARIADGSGRPLLRGDIAVKDGRFCRVAPEIGETAAEIMEAGGLIAAPGFIDCHSHDDRAMLLGFDAANILEQGITTQITGNCGGSIVPYHPDYLWTSGGKDTSEYVEELVRRGGDLAALKEILSEMTIPVNTAFLIGHRTVRQLVMGLEDREPSEKELAEMQGHLRRGMEEGAFGFSTGLIYPPDVFSSPEELWDFGRVAAEYPGALYTTHMRDEAYDQIAAVQEALDLGAETGLHVHISHHKISGKGNEGMSRETLAMIDGANAEGRRVTLDAYPYDAAATALINCIPPQFRTEGTASLLDRLRDPAFRDEVRKALEPVPADFENNLGMTGFDRTLTATEDGRIASLLSIAEASGKDPYDAFFDILIATEGKALGFYRNISREDMVRILRYPATVVGTDCASRPLDPLMHPRSRASFPHFLDLFCKQNRWMTIEEGIRKATGLAADTFGLARKGYIQEGLDADLVLLDWDRLAGPADYGSGDAPNAGITAVYVNGKCAVRDGVVTGVRAGRCVLRGESVQDL